MSENLGTNTSQTVTLTQEFSTQPLTLVLRNPNERNRRQLQWAAGTVDNEHMGKKKSKCCCIYERPKKFDESSSSSSESEYDIDCCHDANGHKVYKLHKKKSIAKVETDRCRGHTEQCYVKKKDDESEENPEINGNEVHKDDEGDSVSHPEV